MNLLDEIQQDLTSPSATAANILRKARVLASQLRSVELQQWAKSELDGYGNNEELPAYRQMRLAAYGKIYGWGGIRRNLPIPTTMLPAELHEMLTDFPVRENVAALEAIIESNGENLQFKHPPEWTELLKKHFEQTSVEGLSETYQPVPKYLYSGILDSIKNKLLEFVLEIKENNVNPDEPNPTATDQDLVRSAVVNHIYGNNNTLAIGNQISQQVSPVQRGDIDSLIEQLRGYEVPSEDLEELRDAISAEPELTTENLGPRVSGWLGKMTTKTLSGAWTTAVQNAPALATEAVKRYFDVKM